MGDASGTRKHRVGGQIDGVTIQAIYGQGPDWIVYRTEFGDVSWSASVYNDETNGRFEELNHEGLRRAPPHLVDDFQRVIGSAFAAAFGGASLEKAFAPVVEWLERPDLIKKTLGGASDYAVYVTTDGHVTFWHKDLGSTPPGVLRYESLLSSGRHLLPDAKFVELEHLLAAALLACFRDSQADTDATFSHAWSYISSHATGRRQMWFVCFTVASAVALGFAASQADSIVFHAAGWGALGAAVSLLSRAQRMDIDPMTSWNELLVPAAARVLLGATFGALAHIAMKADLILGSFSSIPEAAAFASVAAGYSERWIPDLLESVKTDP